MLWPPDLFPESTSSLHKATSTAVMRSEKEGQMGEMRGGDIAVSRAPCRQTEALEPENEIAE